MAPPPPSLYTLSFLLALLVTLLVCASLRVLALQHNSISPLRTRLAGRARIVVVLGSGGHTSEMFRLLRGVDTSKYTHRTYVVSSGDLFSARRAVGFEEALEREAGGKEKGMLGHCVGPGCYTVVTIPRARRVHQSLWTTPVSALRTLAAAFNVLLAPPASASPASLPNLIITNGPGTGVMFILAALTLRFFNARGAESWGLCRTVYVESFARVRTLSLSGRLVVRVVDRFLVQWEALEGYGGRAEYVGVLV